MYEEMACVKFSGIYSPRSQGPLCTGISIPVADGSLVVGIKNSNTKRPGGGGEKIHKLESRSPIFTDFRRFSAVWALLLKSQSATTPSIRTKTPDQNNKEDGMEWSEFGREANQGMSSCALLCVF